MAKLVTLDSIRKEAAEKEGPPKSGRAPNNLYAGSGINVLGRGDGPDVGDDDEEDDIFKRNASKGVEGSDPDAVTIKFYKNGFVVSNQGVLRDPAAPENREFIAAINEGRLPPELHGGARGADADVRLEDHRAEDFVPPPYVAFGGAGSSLGGSSAQPASGVVRGGAAPAAAVDPALPVTTIQVKLLDGRKEKVTINCAHTVADLQARVFALGGHGSRAFVLAAGFPPRVLADPRTTIEGAGLKGAAVVQQPAVT